MLPLSRLHSGYREDAKTWSSLEEIGVFGIGVSEELGGSGLGAVEEALIVMGLGSRLASPGVLATIGAAHLQLNGTANVFHGIRTAPAHRTGARILIVDEPEAAHLL